MKLELEPDEQQYLGEILEQHYRELLWELARTDHRTMKSALRDKASLLERLMQKAQVTELSGK